MFKQRARIGLLLSPCLLVVLLSHCAGAKFTLKEGAREGQPRPEGCHVEVVMKGTDPKIDYDYEVIGEIELRRSKKQMQQSGPQAAMTALKNEGCKHGAFVLVDVEARVTPNGGVTYWANLAVPTEQLVAAPHADAGVPVDAGAALP